MLRAACIVFANKAVFSRYQFNFVITLTWIHSVRGAGEADCECLCVAARDLAHMHQHHTP
jgi:hypothetical protein